MRCNRYINTIEYFQISSRCKVSADPKFFQNLGISSCSLFSFQELGIEPGTRQ